jgi:hypothetical protein
MIEDAKKKKKKKKKDLREILTGGGERAVYLQAQPNRL